MSVEFALFDGHEFVKPEVYDGIDEGTAKPANRRHVAPRLLTPAYVGRGKDRRWFQYTLTREQYYQWVDSGEVPENGQEKALLRV